MAGEADAVTGKASNSKAEEVALAVADQKSDETAAAEVDEGSDDKADPFIRNLNRIGRLHLMTLEWIEEMKKNHYEEAELYNRAYDALESGEIESDDEAGAAEYDEWSKRLWASVDFSSVNTVGGKSRGMDAVAVYPMACTHRKKRATMLLPLLLNVKLKTPSDAPVSICSSAG